MHQEIEFADIQCSFKEKDQIGSGTYAKVYKGKIRGVDVAIKVPNLEKILPNPNNEDKEDGDSSPSSFISASESIEPKHQKQLLEQHQNRQREAPLLQTSPASGLALGPDGKKKSGFGFFRKTVSLDKSFPDLAIGGGPASSLAALDSHSEDVTSPESHDDEELYQSYGEDPAEESHAHRTEQEEEEDTIDVGGDYSQLYSDRFQNFLGEVRMLRELNHPNICLLMGTCFIPAGSNSKLLLVYELMDEDLNSFINNTTARNDVPTLFQKLKIASQVASGLSWVASKGIIHGDLKLTNILRKNSIYKVTDFGLATFEIRTDEFEGGAPIWSAPELLEKRGDASRAVDVFSFGYLLWHILLWKNEEQLYPEIENTAQLIDIVCVRHELPPMEDLPSPLQDLIHECLAYNDTERPTFNHVIEALNQAMLDAAIPNGDKLARKFWMHFFAAKSGTLQESVPTIIFLEKFLRFTGVSSRHPMTEVAKDFFDPEHRGAVTLEHFGRIISLFGPLVEDRDLPENGSVSGGGNSSGGQEVSPSPSPSRHAGGRASPSKKESSSSSSSRGRRRGTRATGRIFQEMMQVREEPWFCGSVSTDKVQETLRSDKPGSYLVRYSNNPRTPSSFCLSRLTKQNQVRHHYIVQRMIPNSDATQKSFGLHVSKTHTIYARSLSDLLHDPRIAAAFHLVHPVNKLSSFVHPSKSSGGPAADSGYLSHWEYSDNLQTADEEGGYASPDDLFAITGSPPSVAFESGPPRPRAAREQPK